MMRRSSYRGDARRDFLDPLVGVLPLPGRVQVLGPLPLFSVARACQIRHAGWRALVMDGKRPLAAVDVRQGSKPGQSIHVVHNRVAAASLASGIQRLRRLGIGAADLSVFQVTRTRKSCVGPSGRSSGLVAPLTSGQGVSHHYGRRLLPWGLWHRLAIRS